MWIRIKDISVKQVSAAHLKNPRNPGVPMVLDLLQRESRTAFTVHKTKKVFPRYVETPAGIRIPKRKWSGEMKEFAQQELAKIPPQKGVRKLTVFGWIFFLSAFGLLGYLVYQGIQEPAQQRAYQQEMAEKAKLNEGDIYFGNFTRYKQKGNPMGADVKFGWFKVVKIEGDTYFIAPGTDMSKSSQPKAQLNSTDFEAEGVAAKAQELEAYSKRLISEDGLTEFYLGERKE